MTKKEQAAFDALQSEIRLLKAWRLTEDVAPDVMPPTVNGQYTIGWYSHAHASGVGWNAAPTASDWGSHFTGPDSVEAAKAGRRPYNGSQHPRRLHSMRSNALKQCRNTLEKEMCRHLADIDKEIEQALAAEAAEASQ
jgi:hypothetical protein